MNANGNKPLEDRLQKSSQVGRSERKRVNSKSIHWADQELMNVTDFGSDDSATQHMKTTSEHTAITIPPQNGGLQISSAATAAHQDTLPLLNDLRSRLSLENSFPETLLLSEEGTTASDEEARQAALNDLITHLEDTAALLREQLAPKETVELDETSSEQTNFLLKYQVVLVFFTQTVSILLLTLFDHLTGERDTGYEVLKRSTGSILQLVNMMLVVFATVVLSRQMLKYKVEGSFLAQTYIATVITFAGLYFIIYRFQPSSWEFASQDKMEDSIAIEQYIRMLYLSVSAATLCGAANIQPRSWYVTLLLCFQSLVNFVYFASILAQTIGNYHSYTVQVRRSSSMSRSNHPPSSRISSKS